MEAGGVRINTDTSKIPIYILRIHKGRPKEPKQLEEKSKSF